MSSNSDRHPPSPSAEISFRTPEDSGRVWRLVAWGRPTIGTPHRGMIVDVEQLELLKGAGIPIYPPRRNGSASGADAPLDIDKLIATLRRFQLTLQSGG
jgi:hypothetical protein